MRASRLPCRYWRVTVWLPWCALRLINGYWDFPQARTGDVVTTHNELEGIRLGGVLVRDRLRTAGDLVLRTTQEITVTVACAYLKARQFVDDQERAAHHALISALLSGDNPDSAAGRAGIRLAPHYTVLALAVAPHPDEQTPGIDQHI